MRRTRVQWQRIVEEYQRSGLSQAAFAERKWIAVASLGSWIYRLREEPADPDRLLLVSVWLRRFLVAGAVCGLAIASRATSGVLVPLLASAHALHLAYARREGLPRRSPLWAAFAFWAVAGVTFFAVWPWIWHSPLESLRRMYAFHATVDANENYLGQFLKRPTFWYLPTYFAVTTPVVTLAAAALGVAQGLYRRRGGDLTL